MRADDEAFHLVADVNRDVALGDGGGTEDSGAAELGGCGGVGAEKAVLGGIGNTGEAANQLLHDDGWMDEESKKKRERKLRFECE